jgi:excisionase family DNA binding protein
MEANDRVSESQATPLEPLLSIGDVAEILRISESGVYRLMRSEDLPAIRIGGRTLFSPDSVRALIAARSDHTRRPTEELEGSR